MQEPGKDIYSKSFNRAMQQAQRSVDVFGNITYTLKLETEMITAPVSIVLF